MLRAKSQQRTRSVQPDRLVIVLADMLRSALTWEQNHGQPPPDGYDDALTGTLRGVYTDKARNRRGGKGHDDHKNSEKDEPHDDLRGPEGA